MQLLNSLCFLSSLGLCTETLNWKTFYWIVKAMWYWRISGSARSSWKKRYINTILKPQHRILCCAIFNGSHDITIYLFIFLKRFIYLFLLSLLQKERTYSFCGTIEYMAPEIIRGKAGHGKVIIWHQNTMHWLSVFMWFCIFKRQYLYSHEYYLFLKWNLIQNAVVDISIAGGANLLLVSLIWEIKWVNKWTHWKFIRQSLATTLVGMVYGVIKDYRRVRGLILWTITGITCSPDEPHMKTNLLRIFFCLRVM